MLCIFFNLLLHRYFVDCFILLILSWQPLTFRNANTIGPGTLGLCLTNLLLIESLIEPNLEAATGAQFEFIALSRIHEYMKVPQEKEMRTFQRVQGKHGKTREYKRYLMVWNIEIFRNI